MIKNIKKYLKIVNVVIIILFIVGMSFLFAPSRDNYECSFEGAVSCLGIHYNNICFGLKSNVCSNGETHIEQKINFWKY